MPLTRKATFGDRSQTGHGREGRGGGGIECYANPYIFFCSIVNPVMVG